MTAAEPWRCLLCGCTETHPCAGGCFWVDHDLGDPPICSACAAHLAQRIGLVVPERRDAVIPDPLGRLLSAYEVLQVHHGDLVHDADALAENGLADASHAAAFAAEELNDGLHTLAIEIVDFLLEPGPSFRHPRAKLDVWRQDYLQTEPMARSTAPGEE